MKRFSAVAFVAGVLLAGAATPAFALQNPEERRRELLERIESLRPTEEMLGPYHRWYSLDYGLWSTQTYSDYHEPESSGVPAWAFSNDTRWWMNAGVRMPDDLRKFAGFDHSVYLRFKNLYTYEQRGDNDVDGPHFDLLYWSGNFKRLKTRLGRRFLYLGRGIVYGNTHDGVDLTLELNEFNIKAFYAHTQKHEHNIDTSAPAFDKRYYRRFVGFQLDYLKLAQHRPYAFYLRSKDLSDEDPIDTRRDFRYDAWYYGLGSGGELYFPNLRYFVEHVWQRGKSFLADSLNRTRIHAYATDLGLEYFFQVYSHPALKLEYAHGSGDAERSNVTNTTGGNAAGFDKNFLYFGTFTSGGFALNARLSNIDVYKVGLTLKPFEGIQPHQASKIPLLWGMRDFTLGANYHVFKKDESLGAISDTRATRNLHDIGQEWDLFFTWRIASDIVWTGKWGHFNTGTAFADDVENEHFLSSSLTFSF
jgi:hypothetical protein